jgi:hypothetical protein
LNLIWARIALNECRIRLRFLRRTNNDPYLGDPNGPDLLGDVAFESSGRGLIFNEDTGTIALDEMVIGTASDLTFWLDNNISISDMNEKDATDFGQIVGHVGGEVFILTPVPRDP